MRNLTNEEAAELGLRKWWGGAPVEIDEVKGATIAGLYMDNDPTDRGLILEIVLILSDGRVMTLSEQSSVGSIEAEFGTLGED